MGKSQSLGTKYIPLPKRLNGQEKESSRMQGGGREKESNSANKKKKKEKHIENERAEGSEKRGENGEGVVADGGHYGSLAEGGTFPSETAFYPAGAGRPGGARSPAQTPGCWAPPPGGCAAAPCGPASTPLLQLPRPRRGEVAVVRGGRAEVRVGLEGGIGGFRMSPSCALPRDSSPGAAGLLLHEHSSCVPLGGPASAPFGDCGAARPPRQAPQSCRSSWEGGSDRRLLPGGVWGP